MDRCIVDGSPAEGDAGLRWRDAELPVEALGVSNGASQDHEVTRTGEAVTTRTKSY